MITRQMIQFLSSTLWALFVPIFHFCIQVPWDPSFALYSDILIPIWPQSHGLFWPSLRPTTLLKKRPWQRYFSVNFATFLRTLFFKTPPNSYFWNYSWEQPRKYCPGWKIFSTEWKTPYNISFFNLFNRVQIFSLGWKSPYNQFLRCLTGF